MRDLSNRSNFQRSQINDFGVFEVSVDNGNLGQVITESIQSFEVLTEAEIEFWQEDGLRIKRVFSVGEVVTAPITDIIVLSGSIKVAKGSPTSKSAFFTCVIEGEMAFSLIEGSSVSDPEPLEVFKYKESTGEYVGKQNISFNTQTITLPSAEPHILRILPLDRSKEVQPRFNNRPLLREVKNWGHIVWTNISGAFRGTQTLTISAEDTPRLKTDSLAGIFQNIETASRRILINRNNSIGRWDISGITDLDFVFLSVEIDTKIALSNWDVSNVTNMDSMFRNSTFNGNISNWDVSNVTNMTNMFRNSSFNGYINNWDVSNVELMVYMFLNTPFNQPLNQWDVSSVTDMKGMLRETPFNGRIGNWDVSSVTDMSEMFIFTPFNQDISKWDVSNVTNMDFMFFGVTRFNRDLSSWCVEQIPTKPSGFDDSAVQWIKPRPNWGQPC